MKRNSLFICVLLSGLLSGCIEKDTGQSGNRDPQGIPVEVYCQLQTERFDGEIYTRSDEALVNNEWTLEEEGKVRDLTVIQFDGTADEASVVTIRTYQNPDLSQKLTIGLMQPLENRNKKQTLCFIANAGDAFSEFGGTLGEMMGKSFSLTETDIEKEKRMVLTGTCVTTIATETAVKATLVHRLAKIRFKFDLSNLPEGDSFDAIWLQLLSRPDLATPFSSASGAVYPGGNAGSFTDGTPVTSRIEEGTVWYVPENRRGTGTNTNGGAAGKGPESVPDSYCTCIYLEGNYKKQDGTAKKVYYRLYPGNDNENNFDVEGNKLYNVTLKITGIDKGDTDSRLTVTEMPKEKEGANCYMVRPNDFLTFSPHNAPGKDIAGINMNYLDRVGTKENCKIDHVGLVWQTEPGLIPAIYHLSASGEFRIKTADMPGNALIAAYDAGNNILWSWHIWVTDYGVDGVNDAMSDNSSAQMTNGNVYKWYGYIWMDRGIGAKSATPGLDAYGMIFQWGRKDPFTSASETASVQYGKTNIIPTYDATGNQIYPSGAKYSESGYIFDKVMNNPTVFYSSTSSSNTDWFGAPIVKYLWNYPEKTCFDPCPAGWGIPPIAAIEKVNSTYATVVYSTSSGKDENRAYAQNLSGLFWPYIGYRDQGSGFGAGAGYSGIYWSAGYYNEGKSKIRIYGGFENTYNHVGGAEREMRYTRDGLGARCVRIPSASKILNRN